MPNEESTIVEETMSIGVNAKPGLLPFISGGFGFLFNINRITSIIPYKGMVAKRLYASRRKKGMTLDCTRGRKIASLIVFDTGEIALSSLSPVTLAKSQM
nr:MAG TPA: protein of unknown function (DUF370) [Caudoviricetes sp.]DAQ35427.1 MAG TPA: protein of unknown function (DUF370) [Caudoviricetes sp.]DAR88565.1 MAG TPA: protein of unknown function (DUF370) [Caudoviricetes sp.]DAS05194.1 MAG TPA: protein of unknown function (DUF370) [Caudoviricetes sp.]DAY30505.1 MAG TPA: protein of unknown function (DUF370) [Caudoviricetes sp.]